MSDDKRSDHSMDPEERERRKRKAREAADRAKQAEHHPDERSDDDRVDEASRESFPASDPPSIP